VRLDHVTTCKDMISQIREVKAKLDKVSRGLVSLSGKAWLGLVSPG
jgi:DNA-binding FrmR family transcriptional regulator